MSKADILKEMKKFYKKEDSKKNNLKFPQKMDVELNTDDRVCKITLNAEYVKKENMQKNGNAFEGWSIAIYTSLKEQFNDIRIRLCLDDYSGVDSNKINGHLARFLYRAGRFCEQYAWFGLSDELCKVLEEKAQVFQKHEYTNNVPEGDAGIKNTHNNENVIETKLEEGTNLKELIGSKLDFGSNPVHRQLPVGLFRKHVKKENNVFTGGRAAIDLWSWNHDTFHVVELKTLNPMIGIITEIFFYANYMRDLLVEETTFTLNRKTNKNDRGYSDILGNLGEFKKVNGIMLADKYHPMLENKADEILEVMNNNSDARIQYYKIDYDYKLCVFPKGAEPAKLYKEGIRC